MGDIDIKYLVKYLVSSPEELDELKKGMDLFMQTYSIEPTTRLNVALIESKHLEISPYYPIEALRSMERGEYRSLDGHFKMPSIPIKIFSVDFKKHTLDLVIGEWRYEIHFGKESQ